MGFLPSVGSATQHTIASVQKEEVSLIEIVELFITLGIIEDEQAARARNAAAGLSGVEEEAPAPQKREDIAVRASILIEHGDKRYGVGEDVEGLILLIENEGDETTWISSNPDCRVLYTIYDEPDDPVYTNRDTAACTQEGLTQFALAPGEMQIFEMTHEHETFPLWRDDYLIMMDYLNYGGGDMWIEVVE